MKNWTSKTILVGIATVLHGLYPVIESGNVSAIDWTQVELGLVAIFGRRGIQKAQDAAETQPK